jgi:hypothetical protein
MASIMKQKIAEIIFLIFTTIHAPPCTLDLAGAQS